MRSFPACDSETATPSQACRQNLEENHKIWLSPTLRPAQFLANPPFHPPAPAAVPVPLHGPLSRFLLSRLQWGKPPFLASSEGAYPSAGKCGRHREKLFGTFFCFLVWGEPPTHQQHRAQVLSSSPVSGWGRNFHGPGLCINHFLRINLIFCYLPAGCC